MGYPAKDHVRVLFSFDEKELYSNLQFLLIKKKKEGSNLQFIV